MTTGIHSIDDRSGSVWISSRELRAIWISLVFGLALAPLSAFAVGLVYVDAEDDFFGTPNLAPAAGGPLSNALDNSNSILDGKWGYRNVATNETIYESTINANPGAEDSPELVMTINGSNGLVSGNSYDIYVAYWSPTDANWNVRGRLDSGAQTLFNRTGPLSFLPNAVAGTTGSSVIWNTPPSSCVDGAVTRPACTVQANRVMLLGKVGTATATGGQVQVYIDDLPSTDYPADITAASAQAFRSWFDGVAFVEAGSKITLDATINRATGQISLANNTGQNVSITGYSITSAAGALNPNTWLSISGNYDGNDGSEFDSDNWNVTLPAMPFPTAATTLSEAEDASGGGSGGALTAATLDLGNAWIRTPIQDLQIRLTLADSQVITVTPQYTGAAIMPGDIDADGDIDLADYGSMMSNMYTNVSSQTRAQTYRLGDMTGDLAIDFRDFRAFLNTYNSLHGAGALEAAIGIPEPTALTLAVLAGLLFVGRRRPRYAKDAWTSASTVRQMTQLRLHLGEILQVCSRSSVACTCGLAMSLLALSAGPAVAQITFVDATSANTTLANGSPLVTTADASGTDGIWRQRAFANPAGAGTVLESGGNTGTAGTVDGNKENAPRLATKITGLTPSQKYAVYGYFWSGGVVGGVSQNWSLQAALQNLAGDLPVYAQLSPTPAAVQASFAAPAPIVTEADRTMYQAGVGVAKASAQGELTVYVDDHPAARQGVTNGEYFRTWYDGVGYSAATTLTLRVNTTTGAVSILNEESTAFDINFYEIRSSSGALVSANWNSFSDLDGNNQPGAGWDETGGSGSNVIAEGNLLGSKSFAPSNSSSIGNIFNVGGTQDLLFSYGLPNSDLPQFGYVEYVAGPAAVAGDYNQNGTVDAADYTVWRNRVGPGSLPNEGGISPGVVDQADYNFWKSRFGMTSGSGSALSEVVTGTNVPEPTVAVIVCVPLGVVLGRRSSWRARRSN